MKGIELFNWESVGTLAGASSITYIFVAYTKRMVDTFWPKSWGTDLYAALVGFLILLAATYFMTDEITWSSGFLAFLNGFLVAAASGKMSDKALREEEKRKEKEGQKEDMEKE
ncbi:MAG: hypothetical protein D5R97_04825 [Candidatus Syntrophonatronum acetioxidans]|uniref:Holin n=1 Tax=Candidatus Syntrophonatronum acetioxidans TaxID=1795816 RepID=A0A424YEP6_9FIRM|nr:MAG: hypothetical protein D5R97_04825 [Candidatus Syntrophonatronum acetioxidans]